MSELESIKFGRLRLRPGVAVYHPSTDDDFGRTAIHPYENIERQEEYDSGIVQIKPKRHIVFEFRLIEVSELILGPSRSVTVPMPSKTGMKTTFRGISDNGLLDVTV